LSRFTVILDACVLYPAPLRDLLVSLAETGLFRGRWTDEIHEEWIRNVLKKRPNVSPAVLNRTRSLMDDAVLDCIVTGYASLIEGLILPDPDDRHVLAAAIVAGADAIVTFNLKDFPEGELSKFGIDALHPDDFVVAQIGINHAAVCAAAKRQRERLRNPPKSVVEFLDSLSIQGLPQTVAALSGYAALI
jgi:hypothetical protein